MAKKRANGEGNIRKRKDGRWEGRYTAGYDEKTGKRITKSVLGKTQAEVKEKLTKAVAEAEAVDVRRADEYTLGTWLQTWYELYAKPHLRFSTAEYYRRGIELHITPRLGDIPLKKLIGRDLQWLYPKTKAVFGKSKRECAEKLAALKTQLGGIPSGKLRPEMRFADWLDYWYETHCKPNIRTSTQSGYEDRIRLHIKPELGEIPLNRLTQNDLQQFYARLKKSGCKTRTEYYGEGLSDRMVRMCHATCRSVLQRAVQDGLIRTNPAEGCKLPPKKGARDAGAGAG